MERYGEELGIKDPRELYVGARRRTGSRARRLDRAGAPGGAGCASPARSAASCLERRQPMVPVASLVTARRSR